jgi:hypothetical protein
MAGVTTTHPASPRGQGEAKRLLLEAHRCLRKIIIKICIHKIYIKVYKKLRKSSRN